ncbi:hypothetical protein C8F01DRAFT_125836 [Mycena amicta]|nr:hypothetical protein C8F01DRAFT_125836 [Mycena amicta]
MHSYHTSASSPSDDEYVQKLEDDDESNAALTSQTLNADGTPKRPMNAFMIFARRRRPQVSAENQSMRTGDISKILSQEWKSMPPTEKQFYQNQAKLLKENFNSKYPDYVYKRRPNNSRKKRKPDVGMAPMRGDRDTDDAESSPDAEDAPSLPDHNNARGYYASSGSTASSSSYASSSYGHHPYNGYSGSTHAHHRSTSYPYPHADAYRSSSSTNAYDSNNSVPRLLNTPYYPPTANTTSHSHYDPSGSPHLGLRKAQSNPTMPPGSGHNGWTGSSTASSSYSNYSGYAPSSNGTGAGGYSHSHSQHSPTPRYAPLPDSPGARYSPFAGASTSSSNSNGSPAPSGGGGGGDSRFAQSSGSPGHSYASLGVGVGGGVNGSSAPRALVSGLGLGGLGVGSAGPGATDSYFWRSASGATNDLGVEKLL